MAYADKFPVSLKRGGKSTKNKNMPKTNMIMSALLKKGGSINKTAGKTTTGVVSNYKGYKGPKSQNPKAKIKKGKK